MPNPVVRAARRYAVARTKMKTYMRMLKKRPSLREVEVHVAQLCHLCPVSTECDGCVVAGVLKTLEAREGLRRKK